MNESAWRSDVLLTMFFYGTLKRGHTNHELFCRGYMRVEEATVRGRLYDLPSGYPALVVPEKDVRAIGTADPVHDASEQQRLDNAGIQCPEGPRVSGELFTFDDPQERLPALDRLECFEPGGSSLYRRVLIPTETSASAGVLAWVYVTKGPSGAYLPGGRWPS